jgi:phosphoenolpyruvate-protein phosphotransferase (PTS system enzyme I)
MTCWRGTVVVPGTARGPLWELQRAHGASATNGTIERFEAARKNVAVELRALPEEMRVMYEALLFDPSWEDGIANRMRGGATIERAISETAEQNARALAMLEDPYLRARAHDMEQIGAQLLRTIHGGEHPPAGAILAASDVSAIELQRWARDIAGLVLLGVSPMAHLAILARGLGLPTIALPDRAIGIGSDAIALLNATDGWLDPEPSAERLAEYPPERIPAQPDSAAVHVYGRRVGVYANVASPEEAAFAASLGADGIGLVRTEFLYIGARGIPSYDEERDAYERIAHAMQGKPIVVRALDLGGDKMTPSLMREREDYGMLGIRGVRLLLRRPELFERHARALIDGFAGADLRVMLPMVALPEEFVRARAIFEHAARSLGRELPPLGIMFEIPAVAYALEAFARAGASFVSIGTNDLAQYFYAADRLQSGIDVASGAGAFRAFLAQGITAARSAGMAVGVCGEAASEASYTDLWLDGGVETLSVAPGLIPWLKRRLRERNTM